MILEQIIKEQIIKEQIIQEKVNWNKRIDEFLARDIYFYYDYFVPFMNNGDGKPILYYIQCQYGKVAYPFMLRDIGESENFKGKIPLNKYYDISSAYGYGGPLYEVYGDISNLESLKRTFNKGFSDFCGKNKIVSQFDRFHPLIKNNLFFKGYSQLIKIRKTIAMDLSSQEEIWDNLSSNCKKNIRKAVKNNVEVRIEDNFNTLHEFEDMYKLTMKRNEAIDYYYFNENFFKDTVENLKNNIVIANAYYNKKIISSALIMKKDKFLHYHFAGSFKEYSNVRANNILIYEVAKWGNINNYKYFHLGGGYQNQDDSLYRFKKSFYKLGDNDFYIGKKIHDLDKYNYLKGLVKRKDGVSSSFFPEYREGF
ncbi:GNAT family N-acetyltransferase [Clostridium sp. DL1XJH146]